jgi:hypothetical protein
LLSRTIRGRFVTEISELLFSGNDIKINVIFRYDHGKNYWITNYDSSNSKLLKRFNADEKKRKNLEKELDIYRKLFLKLVSNEIWDIKQQIKIYQDITTYILRNKSANNGYLNWNLIEKRFVL